MPKIGKARNVLFLSAGHAGGKDYFAKALVDQFGADRVNFCPSPTRTFYADYGIKNEGAARQLKGADAVKFQVFLSDAFWNWVQDQIKQARLDKGRLHVIGKTPIEYTAYQRVVLDPDHFDRLRAERKLTTRMRFLADSEALFLRFRWPPPWLESSAADGFRQVNFQKDLDHSMEMERLWSIMTQEFQALTVRAVVCPSFELAERIHMASLMFPVLLQKISSEKTADGGQK